MKITKEVIQEFINEVPLDSHWIGNKLMCIGVHWGYCQDANETWGRKNVLKILDIIEKDKQLQKLLS